MPDELSHIRQAKHCQATIDHLFIRKESFHDWIAVVAFYKALHLVEAMFACNPEIGHGRNHEFREDWLKRERRYAHIWNNYRPLWEAATIARYLENHGTKISTFAAYMTFEEVQSRILNHHLHQIEQSVKKFLTAKAQEELASIV